MRSSSIYAVNLAVPPVWGPGEEQVACALIGMSLWLAFDVLFCVNRVFKKKEGLYFWSITLGMSFIMVATVGIIVKYLVHGSQRVWELYTLMLALGWTVYPLCQLLVLYSRVHLVNDTPWIRKSLLGLIVTAALIAVVPTWVTKWHAYNPDPKVSLVWSPRHSIVVRFNQLVLMFAESVIGGTYIYSVVKILRGRVGVRQKRVMLDLIYANVLVVTFDVVTVVLFYLNQDAIGHPLQTFAYALKLKLEFLVLNQLMIVAARGVHKKCWEEKRYLEQNPDDNFSAQARKWGSNASPVEKQSPNTSHRSPFHHKIQPSSSAKNATLPPNLPHAQNASEKPPAISPIDISGDHIELSQMDPKQPEKSHNAPGKGLIGNTPSTSHLRPKSSHTSSDSTLPVGKTLSPKPSNITGTDITSAQDGLNNRVPRSRFNPFTSWEGVRPRAIQPTGRDPDGEEIEIALHMWEWGNTTTNHLAPPWMEDTIPAAEEVGHAV